MFKNNLATNEDQFLYWLDTCSHVKNLLETNGLTIVIGDPSETFIRNIFDKLEFSQLLQSVYRLTIIDPRQSREIATLIPAWISKFEQLRYLEIKSAVLTELPDSLSELPKLNVLIFKDCEFLKDANGESFVLKKIHELTNLETLIIKDTRYDAIPETICRLTKLKRFILDPSPNSPDLDKKILNFLKDMHKLTSLVELHLIDFNYWNFDSEFNDFDELKDFSLPPALKVFNISNCYRLQKLSKLPTFLEVLDVSETDLRTLPNEIEQLYNLKELNLKNVPTECIIDDSTLEEYHLSIPDSIINLKNLQQLKLEDTILELSTITMLWFTQFKQPTHIRFFAKPKSGIITNPHIESVVWKEDRMIEACSHSADEVYRYEVSKYFDEIRQLVTDLTSLIGRMRCFLPPNQQQDKSLQLKRQKFEDNTTLSTIGFFASTVQEESEQLQANQMKTSCFPANHC